MEQPPPHPSPAFAGIDVARGRLDAEVLAPFAERVRPAARVLPDASTRELAGLVARRRQLAETITAEDDPPRRAEGTALGRRVEDLLTPVPGVGRVTARTLLALPPELGTLGRREAAALAGLAPVCRDGGGRRGRRGIAGGRGPLRDAL